MAQDDSPPAGARWWRFDFHTHTPASQDYGTQLTPREWLLDFMRSEIDCVAVTDHNSGAWIDRLKEARAQLDEQRPEGFRPLTVFPGVEISVSGNVHILALLDPSKATADVDSLLGAVGFSAAKKGACDAVTSRSVSDVVQEIDRAGGIAIPAHVDARRGIFRELKGQTLAQVFDCAALFAMEVVGSSTERPAVYTDRKLAWSEVLGSDAHHRTGDDGERFPGSHFTWVKMGEPSLDGLRLALLDGPMSVKRSIATDDDPNRCAPLRLESFEVCDARYMGRGTPISLSFSPWLTTIIGGRGTGKSTLVELLRLALRRQGEIPKALEDDLAKYSKVYVDRRDDGLLTHRTKLVATYRSYGARFRVQWSQDGGVEPILEETSSGEWSPAAGEISRRFPARIYSQKQVYELGKAPGALLKVIDDAPEVDRKSWDRRWQEEESRFLSLRLKARELQAGLAEETRLRGELDDIKRKLAVFESAGHTDVLKSYQQRQRQRRVVETWERGWAAVGERIRELADDVTPDALGDTLADAGEAEAALRGFADEARDQIESLRRALVKLAGQADAAIADWAHKRDTSEWKRLAMASETAYESLKQRLVEEGAGDPAAYGQLVQDRQTVEQRLKGLNEQRTRVDQLGRDARASMDRLIALRRELSTSRASFLDDVLDGNQYVKIAVVRYGDKGSVEEEVRRLLGRQDGGFEKDIGTPDGEDGLLASIWTDGVVPDEIEERIGKLKDDVRAIATEATDAPAVRDQRFATHLSKLAPEMLDRLDLWFPEDGLKVQYSAAGDGQDFRSIHEGSPGQKTAALLAFLLSYGEEPLILDQPEDDLDNHLIYGLIVAQLREVKAGRQLIIVTHNPNIVVNGDAELVLALQPMHGQTRLEAEGCPQDSTVRETICAVMEGGREAFTRRYRRIVLERIYG